MFKEFRIHNGEANRNHYKNIKSILYEAVRNGEKRCKLYSCKAEIWEYNHVSGSATITDKKDDEYITVKFDSFKFTVSSESYDFNGSGAVPNSESYVLNGTVQLDLDED